MGRMTSHILWKIKFMFKTTNQSSRTCIFSSEKSKERTMAGWKSGHQHHQHSQWCFYLFLYGLSRFPHSKCHEKQTSESLDLVILGSCQPSAGFWPTIHQFQTLTVHCQSARYLQKMTNSLLVVSRYSNLYQKTKGLKYPCKYSSLFAIIIHHD